MPHTVHLFNIIILLVTYLLILLIIIIELPPSTGKTLGRLLT